MKETTESRKVVLIGTGLVGMSFAYAGLNQGICDELVLIDVNRARAEGEAMDLNHGLAFAGNHMKIRTGDYADTRDADIVVVCAGVPQTPGETRISLLGRNAEIFRQVISACMDAGFDGIFLIASNPVDIMSLVTRRISGLDEKRVIGTGTTLDTARLRYIIGSRFHIDPRNVHAYVIGEHGDSEFVPWSQALLATKPVLSVCREERIFGDDFMPSLDRIETEVREAAFRIIEAKRATYYGIGMAICRIVKAILGNERSVLTVSSYLDGAYGVSGVFAGSPCIVGRGGIEHRVILNLTEDELAKFRSSCQFLKKTYEEIVLSGSRI